MLNNLKNHFNKDLKLMVDFYKYAESGTLKYVNLKTIYAPTGQTIANGSGEVDDFCVGGGYQEVNGIDFCGKLVVAPLFEPDYDPQVNFMFYKQMGWAIYNTELECVHVSKNINELFEDKRKIGDLIYMYGPCALAFVNPEDCTLNNKEMFIRFYKKRVAMLKKSKAPMLAIEKEQQKFEKCLHLLEVERINGWFNEK